MSEWTVVKKENLRDRQHNTRLVWAFFGAFIVSFMAWLFSDFGFAPVVGYGLVTVIAWYGYKDSFPNITRAIEDARGESQ